VRAALQVGLLSDTSRASPPPPSLSFWLFSLHPMCKTQLSRELEAADAAVPNRSMAPLSLALQAAVMAFGAQLEQLLQMPLATGECEACVVLAVSTGAYCIMSRLRICAPLQCQRDWSPTPGFSTAQRCLRPKGSVRASPTCKPRLDMRPRCLNRECIRRPTWKAPPVCPSEK
jgi:hypothetical protein